MTARIVAVVALLLAPAAPGVAPAAAQDPPANDLLNRKAKRAVLDAWPGP